MNQELRMCKNSLVSHAQTFEEISENDVVDDQQIMFERSVTLMHRLLSIPAPQGGCSLREQKQECLRQALLLWNDHVLICATNECTRTSKVNGWQARRSIAHRLKEAICRADDLSASS